MNKELRKIQKIILKFFFFNLKNNTVSEKIMGNVRKHRDTNPLKSEVRRNYLVSEPNCHFLKIY